MATRYAITSGNFNSTATWSDSPTGTGGFSVPIAGDVAVSNNFEVSITTNITCLELRSDNINSATPGGKFILGNGLTITANIFGANGGTGNPCVEYSGNLLGRIFGNLKGGTGILNSALRCFGTGNFQITGNISPGLTGGYGVYTTSTGSLTINGDVGSALTADPGNNILFASVFADSLTSIKVIGNVGSDRGYHGIYFSSNGTIEVDGSVISSCTVQSYEQRYCIYAPNSPSSCLINGTVQTGFHNFNSGIGIVGTSNITINGDIITRDQDVTNSNLVLSLLRCTNGSLNITSNLIKANSPNINYSAIYLNDCNGINVNINSNSIEESGLRVDRTSNGNFTINSNLIGSPVADSGLRNCILLQGVLTTNLASTNTIVITGNLSAGRCRCFFQADNDHWINTAVTIVGNIYAGTVPAVQFNSLRTINLTCISNEIVASESNNAVFIASSTTGQRRMEVARLLFATNGTAPLYTRYYTTTPVSNSYIRYAQSGVAGSSDEFIYHHSIDSIDAFSMPSPSAVRAGVVYADGMLTGTCFIPDPNTVLYGVPVGDSLSGVAVLDLSVLDYSKLWNIPVSDLTIPNSVGSRVKDSVTTEALGKIIQSFGI